MTLTPSFRAASQVAVLITLVLTMASTSCASNPTIALSCDRVRLVALNAFAATHGAYELNTGASVAGDDCADGVLPIELGPRSAMSSAPRWLDEIGWGSAGEILRPRLVSWRLTSILGAVSGDQPLGDELDDQKAILKAIPPDVPIQVVIHLAAPLREHELRALWRRPRAVMLAPNRPLIWEDSIFCEFRGFDTCQYDGGREPLTAQFRQWVNLLRASDALMLNEFNLKLQELQKYANDGLIYAFTARDLARNFQAIAQDSRIRSVYVVDADLPRP